MSYSDHMTYSGYNVPSADSAEGQAEAAADAHAARVYEQTHRTETAVPNDIAVLTHDYHAAWYKAETTRSQADIDWAMTLGDALYAHPQAGPENGYGEAGYPNCDCRG